MHDRMTASWIPQDGIPQVTVVGEVDTATAPELDAALCEARAGDPKSVIVSLEACTFCDSTGLSVLLRHARNTPHLVVVVPETSFVRRVVRLTQADRFFRVVGSVDDARAYLRAS